MAVTNSATAYYIWERLVAAFGNEIGAAALMGNLYAESGMYPDRVQGDIPYSSYSQEYTAQVDAGDITEYKFVYMGPGGGGYGLAQWTYSVRKREMYAMWKNGNYSSIGSKELACDYLIWELQNRSEFAVVLSALKNATTIRAASDVVLTKFENPADQSEAVKVKRAGYGQEYYDLYHGTVSPPIDPDEPDNPDTPDNPSLPKRKRMSLLLMFAATRRKG